MSKDIPIIFSGPMVRALLEGRKTMTRRILKPQPVPFLIDDKPCEVGVLHVEGDPRPRLTLGRVVTRQEIRYAIGDRLWVRESALYWIWNKGPDQGKRDKVAAYAADGYQFEAGEKWTPSIHMERRFSRLTLIVTGVKVERLQAITDADAEAEGIVEDDGSEPDIWYVPGAARADWKIQMSSRPAPVFRSLWIALHGADAWNANPFVVAISFRVIKANIDAAEARLAA